MNWPEDFLFTIDYFGRKWFQTVILSERDVFLVMPIHGYKYMVKEWRCLDLVNGLKNLIGVGYSKRSSLTEIVLRINNYQGFSHYAQFDLVFTFN